MKRARGLILLGLLIVGVVGLCLWLADRAAKVPMVRGEPLDYWLTAGRDQPLEFQAAVAEMDEKCVTYLIAKLEWSPPTARIAINKLTRSVFGRTLLSEDIQPDCREAAALILGSMGTRAKASVESLRRIASSGKLENNHDGFARSAAKASLIIMGDQKVDALVDRIIDPQNTNWSVDAFATLYLATNAAPVVPRLVKAYESASDEEYRGRFSVPLRFVRSSPELSVPILTDLLGNKSESVRFHAIAGLQNFGIHSKSAWHELTNHLRDTSHSIRNVTKNALKKIDPVGAKALGID